MKYLKVPEKLDNRTLYKWTLNGKCVPNGYYLIANELLTKKECEKMNAPVSLLEPVEVKKSETYRMFGARFAV